MLINKDPINSMMAIEAKEKGDIDIERLTKTYFMIDHPDMMNPESKARSGSVQNRAMNPLMLMLMMGNGNSTIDPLMLMLMMGDGPIDPMMMMLMMGDGKIDPMMMMLMMGGLGGNSTIDPLMMMLMMGDGPIDPMMLLLMGGLGGNDEGSANDGDSKAMNPLML